MNCKRAVLHCTQATRPGQLSKGMYCLDWLHDKLISGRPFINTVNFNNRSKSVSNINRNWTALTVDRVDGFQRFFVQNLVREEIDGTTASLDGNALPGVARHFLTGKGIYSGGIRVHPYICIWISFIPPKTLLSRQDFDKWRDKGHPLYFLLYTFL